MWSALGHQFGKPWVIAPHAPTGNSRQFGLWAGHLPYTPRTSVNFALATGLCLYYRALAAM